ncbi:MAG: hypothetical protein ABWX96_21565, partial [Propionibacteriaceae bacterium]
SDRLGERQAYVVSATLRTVVEGELGQVAAMWASADLARAEANRLRIPYGILVLDTLTLPWRAMAGRFAECDELMDRIDRLDEQMSLEEAGQASAEAAIGLRVWQGRGEESVPVLAAMEAHGAADPEVPSLMPVTALLIVQLLRAGQREAARQHYLEHPIDLEPLGWISSLNWGTAAEVALAMADRPLAAAAYERLAPLAGRSCSAGSGIAMGPVDGFLALAAAAVGELELAAQHADRALELMAAWEIPLAAEWLRGQRAQYGF